MDELWQLMMANPDNNFQCDDKSNQMTLVSQTSSDATLFLKNRTQPMQNPDQFPLEFFTQGVEVDFVLVIDTIF